MSIWPVPRTHSLKHIRTPGVWAEVWRGQHSREAWYWSILLALHPCISSSFHPQITAALCSAPSSSSHLFLTPLPNLISKSLNLSRRDLNLKSPDRIGSVFITHSAAAGGTEDGCLEFLHFFWPRFYSVIIRNRSQRLEKQTLQSPSPKIHWYSLSCTFQSTNLLTFIFLQLKKHQACRYSSFLMTLFGLKGSLGLNLSIIHHGQSFTDIHPFRLLAPLSCTINNTVLNKMSFSSRLTDFFPNSTSPSPNTPLKIPAFPRDSTRWQFVFRYFLMSCGLSSGGTSCQLNKEL